MRLTLQPPRIYGAEGGPTARRLKVTIRTRDVSGCLRLALGVILAAQIFLPPTPASAHDDSRPIPPRDRREVVIPDPANLPQCSDQRPIIIPACPPGLELVIFDSPVYDESGLFVICLEKVPFCLPEGLMPEG